MTGCIILVAEEMNFTEETKAELLSLADAADELHLKLSVDYVKGSSTDIDRILQMELWFDFLIEKELME